MAERAVAVAVVPAAAPFTAGALAERFRRRGRDDDYEWGLVLERRWYRGMRTWTEDECRGVMGAAEHCTSVRRLEVNVSGLKEGTRAAELVPLILRLLKCVKTTVFYDEDSEEEHEDEDAEEEGRCGTSGVDTALRGIMKSPSTIKHLGIDGCFPDPQVYLDACACYRDTLQTVFISTEGVECQDCEEFPAFATSLALSWGLLASSLRRVLYRLGSFHSSIPGIVATMHQATKLETVDIILCNHSRQMLRDFAVLCCGTQSVKRVSINCHESLTDEAVNMYSFFDVGFPRSFSATIREVHLLNGAFRDDAEGTLLDRATTALRYVECMRFGGCHFPSLFRLLERLPHLKKLSIVARKIYIKDINGVIEDYNVFDDDIFDDEQQLEEDSSGSKRLLADNEDLSRLCHVIGRPESALVDVELDLVGRGGGAGTQARHSGTSFPATDELLRCAKGRLVLNCVKLPWECHLHIRGGVECTSPDLVNLSLRFHDCRVADDDCAKIIRALRSNRTLTTFEIRLGTPATPESSITALHDLLRTNTSLQVLSLPDLGSGAPIVLDRIISALTDTNRILRVLKLRNANMANRWPGLLKAMKAMLEGNHVFSTIVGCELPTNDPVASEVRELLKLNRYGRQFWTVDDVATKMIWATVLERISNDNDRQVMYKFLRAKPAGERLRAGRKRTRTDEDVGPA